MLRKRWPVIVLLFPMLLHAQEPTEFQRIMQRLDQLERENRDLAQEVHALRAEIAGARAAPPGTGPVAAEAPVNVSQAPLDERMAVQEQRSAELAQTKVEAAQRMPVTLTGMVLFNSFLNSGASGGAQDPLTAAQSNNVSGGGASLSQSIIGLRFQGPRVLGGQVRGSLDLDLWGGTASSLNHLVRMRVASLEVDWKNTTLMVGQDKPLIAPRDPDSLAQVAFSPLTDAGNLWLWSPQVRFEQRFAIGDNMGVKAQASVYQTSEPAASATPQYQATLSGASPGVEGRLEFWSNLRVGYAAGDCSRIPCERDACGGNIGSVAAFHDRLDVSADSEIAADGRILHRPQRCWSGWLAAGVHFLDRRPIRRRARPPAAGHSFPISPPSA